MTKHPRSFLGRPITWLALAILPPLGAQTPATSAGTSAPPEDVLKLNPFTVSTDRDRGYAASSTLAGTRLNTALRDVAASVTVVTPDFMADLGAFTLADVISHTVNAEQDVANFNTTNNSNASTRIRGTAVNSNSQDFFNVNLPLDIYNLEQISINRGPNSLLFGVGNPAGTVTGVSKRAIFKDHIELSASLDRWDGWRASFDVNRVLVPQRLALRVAGLHRDTNQFIEPAYWQEDRIYAAATARLFTRRNWSTTLRVNAEFGETERVVPDRRTAVDGIALWRAAGANTVDGVRAAANPGTLPAGVVRAAAANQLVVIDGSPVAVPTLNWLNTSRGGLNNAQNPPIGPSSAVPARLNYNGATRSSDYRGDAFTFFVEQEFGRATSVELAYGQSERDLDWVRSDGGASIFVDTNRLLPNGNPNPNVGKFYTQGTSRLQPQYQVSRQLRLTGSHLLDLNGVSRWLGQHRFGALVSREFSTFALDDLFEVNATPLAGYPTRLDNVQNRIVRRTYLFLGGGDVWLPGRRFGDIPPIRADGISSRYYNERVVRNDSRTDSLVLAVQGKSLKERLATTFGYRWDDLAGYALDPAFALRDALGEIRSWRNLPLGRQPGSTLKNGTLTAGAVLHVFPQLSLVANKSKTSAPAPGLFDMYGATLPTPMGTGEDYGVKFSLFGGRLTGSLVRFDTNQTNQLISSVQALGPRISQIGTVVNRPDLVAVADPRDTQDIVANGYELELIWNPTREWRISANGSRNSSVLSNVNSRAARFLDEKIYPLEAQFGSLSVPSGRTIAQELADFRTTMRNNKTAVEGRQAEVLREWNGNVVTNYRFAQGRLRGLAVGGNVQYRGPAVIGALIDPVTNIPNFANPIEGRAFTLVGAHVRYERKLFQRYEWHVALHVRNLFDDDRLIEKSASATDGAILVYDVQEPRSWMLSTGVKF